MTRRLRVHSGGFTGGRRILQEWLTGLGQRTADKRIAHLFCELHARLQAVGLTSEGEFELPLTQQELSDTVGISVVHVNRSLRALGDLLRPRCTYQQSAPIGSVRRF